MGPRENRFVIATLVTLLFILVAGCSVFHGNPFVGDWLDAAGSPVPDEDVEGEGFVLDSFVGSGHCDWDSATFLLISWPPGRVDDDWVTSDIDDGTVRLYVRDPDAIFASSLQGEFNADAELPTDAVATGLHRERWEIWTSPDDAAIYLVGPDHVEQWQRATTFIGCA